MFRLTKFNIFIISCFIGLNLSLLPVSHAALPAFSKTDSISQHRWVDSVYRSLTLQQKIGQLIMVRANSNADSTEIRELARQIRTYNLGGLCFFKGGPVRQAALTNYYQRLAATPLLVSMDAEWGPGMRIDSMVLFPRQMTLGAMKDESLITSFGLTVAAQLKRLGVHVSFSPVADINNNPANPVINIRSFGQNKEDVARKAILYMKALQQGGIITVAKHFPGHGDTDTDSHYALPLIAHPLATLDTLELYPFRRLIAAGVDGMMVAHLNIPAFETVKSRPSTLSQAIVTGLLREKCGFNGLVFTDALDMKGVANYDANGNVELRALQAGNDILLLPVSVDNAVNTIQQAIDSGKYSMAELEMHCRRVLAYKYKAGLAACRPVALNNIYRDLHTPEAEQMVLRLYENSITLIKNEGNIIPLQTAGANKLASVTIGYDSRSALQDHMDSYACITHFMLPRNADAKKMAAAAASLSGIETVIININNTIPNPAKNFGISDASIRLVDSLLASKKCILNLFTLPYAVPLFKNIGKAQAVIIAYQDNPDAYDAVAQALFGANAFTGHLPVSAGAGFPVYTGIETAAAGRLRYNPFENNGIAEGYLRKIDTIVMEGIRQKAYPGCQVLIARDGNVIYNKAFGNSDYISNRPVANTDIYDLASITKVAATTLAAMKLYDEGKLKPGDHLSSQLEYLAKSNKRRTSVSDVMLHQAGLVPWIPFYKKTLKNGFPDSSLYRPVQSPEFPVRVAKGLYLRRDYFKTILDSIVHSPVAEKKSYKYSDLGFILLQQYIEKLAGTTLDTYASANFYSPMGLCSMTFRPLEKFSAERIMPTENDMLFRRQLLRGDVHDQAAALMGGVAGHAGLFGTAGDLAGLFQMLLQKGYYGGRQYIDTATVELFTQRQVHGNRRGLGFDKPQLRRYDEGPACPDAPASSFGHTGFTGTYVWADPDNQLLIVFLSNRVNPDAEVNKLVQLGTRTRIQQTLYDAIGNSSLSKQPWKTGAIDIPHN